MIRRESLALNTAPTTLPQPAREVAIDVLARTIWGEAPGRAHTRQGGGCLRGPQSRRPRAGATGGYWWGGSVVEVCQKPWQFSCWNTTDPNRATLLKVTRRDPAFAACLRIARRAVAGNLPDPTGGATHYHARNVHPPWAWRLIPCAEIGRHLFYNDVE